MIDNLQAQSYAGSLQPVIATVTKPESSINNPLPIFPLLHSFYPLPLKSKEGAHWELKV